MKSSFRMVVLLGVAAATLASSAGHAQVIYRDPVTGQIGVPPPGVVPVPTARQAAPAPPTETPGTTAAGGMKMSLRGQPRDAFVGTRDTAGQVRVECVPGVQP